MHQGVDDVSALHGIKYLRLIFCSSIEYLKFGKSSYRLMIAECFSINRRYESLRSVRHSKFLGSKVTDLSVFRDVQSLG